MQINHTIQHTSVPALGFGTWLLKGNACRESVADALRMGYRHIDTARMYKNETEVGQGLKDSGVAREEVFLTTKIWFTELQAKQVLDAAHDSLQKLNTDYVDLLLIHWPSSKVPLGETLEALRRVQEMGKAKHIGVSNFPPALLQEAIQQAPIFCNQVEYHPFLSQSALLDVCRQHTILLTAYSPLANGKVANEPILVDIGKRYGKTSTQVTLRWLVQQPNVAAIPKAGSTAHRQSNLAIFDFALTAEEMQQISQLAQGKRLINPGWAPAWEK